MHKHRKPSVTSKFFSSMKVFFVGKPAEDAPKKREFRRKDEQELFDFFDKMLYDFRHTSRSLCTTNRFA